MRIKQLRLRQFKRFDDLTINLGEHPARIIAMVGPNGCGKSCVFDAFEEQLKNVKGANANEPNWFFSKSAFHPVESLRNEGYERSRAISIEFENPSDRVEKKSFHLRSAYRFTSALNVTSITAQPNILDDIRRPHSSVALDSRLQENYQRLLGLAFGAFETGEKTGNQVREELLGKINGVLRDVLDVRVSSIGNVLASKGQLYFEKDDARDFPYQNLSSGEKEVIDLIVDLVVHTQDFDDTIYAIDEPELHISTSIQRKLLTAVEGLIPSNCQLWVATHSIGFLRALQDDLAEKSAILDFSEKDFDSGAQTIVPIIPNRKNWQRIFATALDDLAGLVAPQRIVYCEGKAEPDIDGAEQGFDSAIYNEVFAADYPTTLFVSSGGNHEVKKYGSLALKVLQKAFLGVDLLLLNDRDIFSDQDREEWLRKARHHRMLERREIENYLFDPEVLSAFCNSRGFQLSRTEFDRIVSDCRTQDLKLAQTVTLLKSLCEVPRMTNMNFKKGLAEYLRETAIYSELESCIFHDLVEDPPAAILVEAESSL